MERYCDKCSRLRDEVKELGQRLQKSQMECQNYKSTMESLWRRYKISFFEDDKLLRDEYLKMAAEPLKCMRCDKTTMTRVGQNLLCKACGLVYNMRKHSYPIDNPVIQRTLNANRTDVDQKLKYYEKII